jgi:hypothetical protein
MFEIFQLVSILLSGLNITTSFLGQRKGYKLVAVNPVQWKVVL